MKPVDYGVVRVRPATRADAKALAPKLRPADLLEISAHGKQPLAVLTEAVKVSSAVYAAETDEGVIALFGVAPMADSTLGSVWMLGSPGIERIKLTFLRHCSHWLKVLFGDFRLLGNVVDARNTVHINWLRWLGFRFLRRIPNAGVNGEEFIEFILLRE